MLDVFMRVFYFDIMNNFNFTKLLIVLFVMFLIRGVAYGQNSTIEKYQNYADIIDRNIMEGLNFDKIEIWYLDNIINSKDTTQFYEVKLARISVVKTLSYSQTKTARKEGLKEIEVLVDANENVTNDQILGVLDKYYKKFVDGYVDDYLKIGKSGL
jgi:hypothetical protein